MIVLIAESGYSNQSFTYLKNIINKMTGDKVIQQHIQSNSSIESIDHQTPESGTSRKVRAKSKEQETRELIKVNGKQAWDKLFLGEKVDIPHTKFMEKVKAAVSETDYQDIKKGIIDTLQDEKDYLLDCIYSTPTEAANKIHSMLTEIIIMEAGHVINYDFKVIVQERSEVKRKLSQVDYNTNRANAIKSSYDALNLESKLAREDQAREAQDD